MQLFEKIRQDNIVKYGTRVNNYIPIIINQYSDRTHFIYEILQNAEDAEATYIKFQLYRDKLVMIHDGRPFNEQDIVGVCGIADGSKDDGTRIGHFGIGFKAVYGYTETPEIYSGKYQFKIIDYLNPYETKSIIEVELEETCMILPFNKSKVSSNVAFQEIQEALLKKITAESILMLDTIREIEIDIVGGADHVIISKEKGFKDASRRVYELSLLTTYENRNTHKQSEQSNDYLLFTDGAREAVAIIFKVEGKELQEIKNSKIYAFFPTAKEAHQKFLIHAPFDTTPARDNFKEGAEYGKHNITLINNIGKLILHAFIWLRDNSYLTFSGFNRVFPIYEYDEGDILYAIYKNSVDIINSGEPILPTNKEGVYKGIHEICVPENMGIVNVFDDTDLHRLLNNRKIFWLSKEISTNTYIGLKTFLDKNCQFKTYEWKHLVLQMDASFLEGKRIMWMEKLMGNIESFCIKRVDQQRHFMDVSRIPFVRLVGGKHICAKENGVLQVYLNNPNVSKFKIQEEYRNSEIIRSFLERAIGIPIYNIERETIDKILPKYMSKKVRFLTNNPIKENIKDLKEMKDAIQVNPLIIEQMADKYIVTDGKEWYRASDLYIRSSDIRAGYSLVKGVVDIQYLANSYFDDTEMSIRLDEEFFRQIGCSKGIRTNQVTKGEYLDAVRKYCGKKEADNLSAKVIGKEYISKKWDWSFNYEGFPEVFRRITPKKSIELARFLNNNATKFDIKGELVGADDKNFNGSRVDSAMAYSMLGLQLCFEKWVYINGNPEPQSPVDVDKEDLIEGYLPAKRLMNMLPFREVKNVLTTYFESIFKDKDDIELVKEVLSNPQVLMELAQAKVKSDAKQHAKDEKRGTLSERLERGDRKQKEIRNKTEGLEITPISEKAMAKREEKLEEEFKKSLDFKTRVTRGLNFGRKNCSKEERIFLEDQYSGYCQICNRKIIKHDGSSYFEAINIIKPSTLHENLINSLELAWNSLCLCPNCAAEYNYSSKKISSIYEQVMAKDPQAGSEEPIEITIEMPEGLIRTIKYSPRHYLALKQAFKVFTKE